MISNILRATGASLALLLTACGARGEPAPGALPEVAEATQQPADTMVLEMPGGNTVWLAEGRRARDSALGECFERSVEIRRDSTRLKVPLLFTFAIPNRLDDSTILAVLYRDCRPSAVYRVGVRDGLPHRMDP